MLEIIKGNRASQYPILGIYGLIFQNFMDKNQKQLIYIANFNRVKIKDTTKATVQCCFGKKNGSEKVLSIYYPLKMIAHKFFPIIFIGVIFQSCRENAASDITRYAAN